VEAHKEKARLDAEPSIRTHYATSAWQYQPCRPPSTHIKIMAGSHNNSPRPMTSSCFTSFQSAVITKSIWNGSAPRAVGRGAVVANAGDAKVAIEDRPLCRAPRQRVNPRGL